MTGASGDRRAWLGRDPWFAAILVSFVVIHGATNLIIPMASYRALQLGVKPEGLGLLATAFSIPPLIVALRVGRIVDRTGGRPLTVAGLLLMTAAGVMLAAAPSAPWVFAAFSVLGLGHMTAVVAMQGAVARVSDEGSYDHRFSNISLAASLGQLVGPAVGGLVVGQGSPDETVRALLVGAGLAAAGLPVSLLLWRPALWRPARAAANEPARAAANEPAGADTPSAPAASLASIVRTPGLLWAVLVSATVLSATDIILTYLPALGEERHWPASLVGALLAIRAASSMAIRIFLGRLAARYGRAALLAVAMLVSATAFVVLAFAEPLPLVVLLMVAIGAGLGIGQPMTIAWVASLAEPRARATAISVRMIGNRLGQVALPAAAGGMAAMAGVGGVLAATGLMVAVGIVGVVGGRRRQRRQPPPEDR